MRSVHWSHVVDKVYGGDKTFRGERKRAGGWNGLLVRRIDFLFHRKSREVSWTVNIGTTGGKTMWHKKLFSKREGYTRPPTQRP